MEMIPIRRDDQKREERPRQAARLTPQNSDTRNLTRSQAPGQLRRAAQLEEQAQHRHAFGDWPGARRLLHEAHRLRRLAAGPRPEAVPVDIERALSVDQLGRWAGRGAA